MTAYTIVAFYGPKTPCFATFIETVMNHVKQSSIGEYFEPYALDQVHATIVGLESIQMDNARYNLNIWEEMEEKRQMKLEGCLDQFVRYTKDLSVRFGGFNASFDEKLSWNQSLYLRSFGIHPNTLKVVLNGWPVISEANQYRLTDAIWLLRSSLYESHSMRHKYHALRDNDMFMVVGDLKRPISKISSGDARFGDKLTEVNHEVQQMLADREPHYEVLSLDQIKLVSYENDSLETITSQSWPIGILDEDPTQVKKWLGLV